MDRLLESGGAQVRVEDAAACSNGMPSVRTVILSHKGINIEGQSPPSNRASPGRVEGELALQSMSYKSFRHGLVPERRIEWLVSGWMSTIISPIGWRPAMRRWTPR
jgi:hypothetical protein